MLKVGVNSKQFLVAWYLVWSDVCEINCSVVYYILLKLQSGHPQNDLILLIKNPVPVHLVYVLINHIELTQILNIKCLK